MQPDYAPHDPVEWAGFLNLEFGGMAFWMCSKKWKLERYKRVAQHLVDTFCWMVERDMLATRFPDAERLDGPWGLTWSAPMTAENWAALLQQEFGSLKFWQSNKNAKEEYYLRVSRHIVAAFAQQDRKILIQE